MVSFPAYEIYSCGDHAYTLDLGQHIDVGTNRFIIRLFKSLQHNKPSFILDIIPAYSSITIVYDPLALPHEDPEEIIHLCFTDAIHLSALDQSNHHSFVIRIPVCYHPSIAPDLEALCSKLKMNTDSFIAIHTAKPYRVFMNGFLPGFAYMGSVDNRIASPRHQNPRKVVPAGSVGIAGNQTGIYPLDSPGGWQLIGKTTVSLFDPLSDSPCLLQPGDEVVFYPISLDEFQQSIPL